MIDRPELRIDAEYRDTVNWKNPKDQFNKMFRVADGKGIVNSGGFRWKSHNAGKSIIEQSAFVILVTNLEEDEWPDSLNVERGIFTYWGDNRTAGKELHATTKGGNRFLVDTFNKLHVNNRLEICPVLCFQSINSAQGHCMKFIGLAAPGAAHLSSREDLVAVWRASAGTRFQNYRSAWTVLDVPAVSWEWLDELANGVAPLNAKECPAQWREFAEHGIYKALEPVEKIVPRKKQQQMPHDDVGKKVLTCVRSLSDREFEFFAAEIIKLIDQNYVDIETTRRVKDGGYDVVGKYRIPGHGSQIELSFFGEAKRWTTKSIGVGEVSRLISRVKHRDFGFFVTTSYFEVQVQQELIDDKHPIKLISGGDIVKILMDKDYVSSIGDVTRLEGFLAQIQKKAGA